MAIAVAQTAFNAAGYTTTSATTVAITLTVAAGSTLVVWVTWDDTTTVTCSVADPTNGTYTAGPVDNFTAVSQAFGRFYKQAVAAGSTTITATFGASANFRGIWVAEITGAVTTGGSDGSSGNTQSAPGTGADAVTTGAMTNAAQPALIIATAIDIDSTTTPAAGTGFTSAGSNAALAARVESKRITATGSQAGTFTAGTGADHFWAAGFVFDEAAGGGTTVSLTGQGATSAGGASSAALAATTTGQGATAAGGAASPLAGKALTGAASSSAAGAPASNVTAPLGGQASTSAAGTVSPATSGTVTLTGQAVTSTAGTLLRAATLLRNWVGQAATSDAGTVVPQADGTATLIGQAATSAAGSLAPGTTLVLGGQAAATAAGALGRAIAAQPTGQAGTTTAGLVGPLAALGLAGDAATSGAGTLTPLSNVSTDTFAMAPCPPTMAVGLTFTLAQPFAPQTPTRAQ